MSSNATERMGLSEYQTKVLEKNFKPSGCMDETTLILIAAECGLSVEETQKWFALRMAQWRQDEGLPAERRSVLD